MSHKSSSDTAIRVAIVVGIALFAVALWVRGIGLRTHGARANAAPTASASIPEPMQLLSRAARERIDARWRWIAEEHKSLWTRASRYAFDVRECPRLVEWLATPRGADTERLIGTLTGSSTAEEGLTSLALIFQVARATSWQSGVMSSGVDAAKLAEFLERWLSVWAPSSANDPLLGETARAALCLWGRATREAVRAPLFGSDDAVASHARVVIENLTQVRGPARTAFGEAFAQNFPRALAMLVGDGDFLRGLADDAARLFPEIDGACGS